MLITEDTTYEEYEDYKNALEEECIENEIKEYMGYKDPPDDCLPKDKARGERRLTNIRTALNKRNTARRVYRYDWYDNLHEYSKGKIHCSCYMCRIRSNNKKCIINEPPMRDKRKLLKIKQELTEE